MAPEKAFLHVTFLLGINTPNLLSLIECGTTVASRIKEL
jgi:hypothetical protein